MLQLCFYKCSKFFQPLKPLFFGFHYVNPYLPQKIINKNNKTFCSSHGHILHGATNVAHLSMRNAQNTIGTRGTPGVISKSYGVVGERA